MYLILIYQKFIFVFFLHFFSLNKSNSCRDLTIFKISFIFVLEITNFVKHDSKIFFWIAASVADTAAINGNGIKVLLSNGFSTFFIKGNPAFINGPKILPKNPLDWPFLWNWFFGGYVLADKLFAKVLWSLEIYVFVNNKFCVKLVSSPTAFDEKFKVTPVPFFCIF